MRRLLLTAPPWVSAVIGALVTVALWILTFGVEGDHESGLSLVVGGCLVAGLTSAFEWRDLRRQRREVLSATGPLAPDERGPSTALPTRERFFPTHDSTGPRSAWRATVSPALSAIAPE